MKRFNFLENSDQFEFFRFAVENCLQIKASIPEKVFQNDFRYFYFEEFDWAMSANFWPYLQKLCQHSGDSSLLVSVLDPDPITYYKKEFGYYNWAVLPALASSDDYWALLNHFPEDSPADSLLANSEKVSWLPASRKWAVWGERRYATCILGYRKQEIFDSWNDVEWALETTIPNAFLNGVIPLEFIEKFRRNYGGSKI